MLGGIKVFLIHEIIPIKIETVNTTCLIKDILIFLLISERHTLCQKDILFTLLIQAKIHFFSMFWTFKSSYFFQQSIFSRFSRPFRQQSGIIILVLIYFFDQFSFLLFIFICFLGLSSYSSHSSKIITKFCPLVSLFTLRFWVPH